MIRKLSSFIMGSVLFVAIIATTYYFINRSLDRGVITNAGANKVEPVNSEDSQKDQEAEEGLPEVIDMATVDDRISIGLDLNRDGENDYQLLITGIGDQRKIEPVITGKKKAEHKYMTRYTYTIDLNEAFGQVIVDMDYVEDTGLVYYIEYIPVANGKYLSLELIAGKNEGLEVCKGYYEGRSLRFQQVKMNDSGSLPNIVNYIDGVNSHIQLCRVFLEKSIGETVTSVEKLEQDMLVVMDDMTTYKYALPTQAGYSTKVSGMVSLQDLVNDKSIAFNLNTLGVMDFANEKYVWKDGVHYENPMLYEPDAENDFYLTPSGLHIRACYWVLGKGSIYDTYGISLMYSYVGLYNDKNYIPTVPKSGWLYGEYGIEGNFYDTRFNTDTVSGFMHMQEKYPDDEIKEAMDRYFEFFKSHVETNSFYVDDQLFVADYMNYSGEATSMPHCSLNHMLEEMTVMFRYGQMYDNKEIFSLAEGFLESIMATKDQWIKPDGDLLYCVTADGDYIKQDYPLVTYNDLNRGEYTLRQIYGEAPEDYMAILESKKKWAKSKGLIQ